MFYSSYSQSLHPKNHTWNSTTHSTHLRTVFFLTHPSQPLVDSKSVDHSFPILSRGEEPGAQEKWMKATCTEAVYLSLGAVKHGETTGGMDDVLKKNREDLQKMM